MNHRTLRTTWQLTTLLLVAVTIYLYHDRLAPSSHLVLPQAPKVSTDGSVKPSNPGTLSPETVNAYVKTFLDPEDATLPKLSCPRLDTSRYEYLKPTTPPGSQVQYFFALNLRECLPLLPRLLGSLVDAIRFLGPEHCAVSIVEGNSPDGTGEVLSALQSELGRLLGDRVHFLLAVTIDPLTGEGNRFTKLAQLRNIALQPLVDDPDRYTNATVVFMNDVAICVEDILELVHQRLFLGSDMTCAFDWVLGGDGPIFYDSYISRSIVGDLFFNIPPETASYSAAHDLFWNEPRAQARFNIHRPFQVFSCWNGAVAFTAAPVAEGKVAFRGPAADNGECHQGEPQLFCKDMWFHGYGRIAVVPTVNLAYTDEDGQRIKKEKGYTSQWVAQSAVMEEGIEWLPPPELVKCMPTFNDQTWRAWNETMSLV